MVIGGRTRIAGAEAEPVRRAAADLERDIAKRFSPDSAGDPVRLVRCDMGPEMFRIVSGRVELLVEAADELGFIYGLYEISRRFLGIHDFWFWMDQDIGPREPVTVQEDFFFASAPYAVRYRGWFINDEVLLHAWSLDRNKDKPWEMAMEALLRCGGNMVIPGTDKNAARYRPLAAARGLYITHHHAEPLGAEMFARAYPALEASYDLYPDKFRGLWRAGIEAQRGCKVIWNLGFRGQGDCPFWANDPRYATDESRGKLLSELIRAQYDMVKAQDPDAVCCTNLYGEIMELSQKGLVELPADVIRIWADNGYGRMVSRRQGNHNPRVPSLPAEAGRHGIYYHVSFYDLQAANHMTLLPNPPEAVAAELERVMEHGANGFWIINSSNIKPHVYYLDLIAAFWRGGAVSPEEHRARYAERYYGAAGGRAAGECIDNYFRSAVKYGENDDDLAGEQFVSYVPRMLITQYMRDSAAARDLLWMADRPTLREQAAWYREKCREGAEKYRLHLRVCASAALTLEGRAGVVFADSLLMQAKLLSHMWQGALYVCESMELAFAGDYQRAFYLAGRAKREYEAGDLAMREREHGKWHNFYQNECLTDVKQTAWVLEAFMGYLRCLGDGPHYYVWQREFLYPEEDRRVMLITNMENHLRDDELFRLMDERWGA